MSEEERNRRIRALTQDVLRSLTRDPKYVASLPAETQAELRLQRMGKRVHRKRKR